MTTFVSSLAAANKAAISPSSAGQVTAVRGSLAIATAPVANDNYHLVKLPARAEIVDFVFDADDMDSGTPALAFQVGFADPATGVVGSELRGAGAIGQAVGLVRMDTIAALRIAPVDYDRVIGIKCTTIAATFVAGTVGLTLSYAESSR